uniref:transcription initiation factor TFIID subunit 4-like isoform X2 n=1 Tax=Doryrhamphus excisus TaxID=161450 RepID=UPI0025AE4FEA|nr:transcription initiation factor TFIID subunit 4-like isoform X2 [Doryrhamphus excisus]
MAAGSESKDDAFFKTEADKKVISDVAESALVHAGHVNTTTGVVSTPNHTGNSTMSSISNVESNKMTVSQPDLAKAGTQVHESANNSVDRASETTTATQNKSVLAVLDSTSSLSKVGMTVAQTMNGRVVLVNSHADRGAPVDSSVQKRQSTSICVNNGLTKGNATTLSTTPTTIIRTSSTSLISPATVTLVRPETPTTSQCAIPSFTNRTALQSGTHGAVSSVTVGSTALTGSPIVTQNQMKTVPTTSAVTPVLNPRLSQSQQNIQNIQIPAGMVLVRSESGQLLMIHQQTLAQMQAQAQSLSAITPRPSVPSSSSQTTSQQAPGASLLACSVTPTAIIKQGSAAKTAVSTSTLQRPPVLQNKVALGGNATTLQQLQGTPTTVQPASAVPALAQSPAGPLGATGNSVTPTAITAETLQNVKKCRDFLSTLIKLASSKKQSSETIANVQELIKNLLDAKIEPEEFTTTLYKELNSSPQPYLVPFLKRSLPALRQMTPNSEAFIHQSLQPRPSTQPVSAASTALATVVFRPPLSSTASVTAVTSSPINKTTVITLTQPPYIKPRMIETQQQGTMRRSQVTLAQSPVINLRGPSHSRIILGQPPVVKQLNSVSAVTQTQGANCVQVVSQTPLQAAQKNKMQTIGGATFRDDDDINDVASMAGVNLSEESARILATNSVLVGAVTRSCKDEAFLSTSLLTQRTLDISKNFGVSELGVNVVNYISLAAQFRLQRLVEKASQVAQQKNSTFKEDQRHEQVTNVRAQLKLFEQLDQMEKQKKEDQEREILLKAAKSRSRQEDPEQLRLKQKAKEMQQQELAQIRQREANLTALAAIGPRKKRKMDSPLRGSSAEVFCGRRVGLQPTRRFQRGRNQTVITAAHY